tara:strand:+ start:1233 stop:2357 length:1125 start_codon:yes stop_codon:yes gene_type:complete
MVKTLNDRKIYFNSSDKPTIGVEVELYTISKKTFDLCQGAPILLEKLSNDTHIKEELLESIIEVNTSICNNVDEVFYDLNQKINLVKSIAEKHDMFLISMATHPFASWKNQSITDNNRYKEFLDRMQWPLRRLLITGLHVHVGVESGEKAISIMNGLASYIPHMIALSANSPFYDGDFTGLASTRTKIFESLPNAGIPPYLKNYSEFQNFMMILKNAKTIESIREVWWDIRPHPGFGTVEVRVFDAVPSLKEMVDLAALIQCMVVRLSESYKNPDQQSILNSWIIKENKWRALRYGLDASILDKKGQLQSLKEEILETIDDLLPISKRLNCEKNLLNLAKMIKENNTPYLRQIRDYKKYKSFKKIIEKSIRELN